MVSTRPELSFCSIMNNDPFQVSSSSLFFSFIVTLCICLDNLQSASSDAKFFVPMNFARNRTKHNNKQIPKYTSNASLSLMGICVLRVWLVLW